MPESETVAELRRFILSYAEHDSDCPGVNANAWSDQVRVCVCGLAPKLDDLMHQLEIKLGSNA